MFYNFRNLPIYINDRLILCNSAELSHSTELINPLNSGTRKVLREYSPEMLKTIWSMSLNCSVIFYTLWAIELNNEVNDYLALISVLPFIAILLLFSRLLENGKLEAPEEIILKNRGVLISGFIWLAIFILRIYG